MLVYRAMWSHDDGGVVAAAVASFRRATGDAGEVERAGPSRADGIADVVRAVATRNGADGSCQVTTLRAWTGEACARTGDGARARVWVDVDARGNGVGGDLLAAPPLVLDLLEGDAGAARGGVLLAAPGRPQRCSGAEGAEVLADLVTGLRRDVAVVVLGPPQDPADAPAVERFAQAAASAVAGSAVVCVLDAVAAAALVGVVGAEHAVEAGACRVYLPGMDPALDEAHRHVTWYPDPDAEAVDQLVRAVGPTALTLRPDESYDAARAVLRRQRIERLPGEAGEWLAAVEEDNDRLADALDVATRELEAQRRRTAELERERATLVGERVELRGRLARVRTLLRDNGLSGADAPDGATTCTQAWRHAVTYLDDHLVVPDAACVDLADLDAAVEARAWGRASWKAFRALHAYGAALAEADPGTFWTWCERSGLWPATPKKLAMTESDTVQQDRRLRSRRMLPVARAVAPSGRVEMFAHVKVAEGGGTLIPRIYFHVDLAGARVHVGYFGPHRGMPNTLT